MSNNQMNTQDQAFFNKCKMFCIWDSPGDNKEVFSFDEQGPYTESVNTFTTGWLDVAVLFNTESEAQAFNTKYALDGIVYNVGDFINEHSDTESVND